MQTVRMALLARDVNGLANTGEGGIIQPSAADWTRVTSGVDSQPVATNRRLPAKAVRRFRLFGGARDSLRFIALSFSTLLNIRFRPEMTFFT